MCVETCTSEWLICIQNKIKTSPRSTGGRGGKSGCRSGMLMRLWKWSWQLPSIFLSNSRSLANKMDELKLQVATNNTVKDNCILVFKETWPHPSIPDTAIELAGHTVHQHYRTRDSRRAEEGVYVFMWVLAGIPTLKLKAVTAPQTWSIWLLNAGPYIFCGS